MSSTTSILRFTSILGSLDSGDECVGERPISYLLEVDQCKILLDCGSTSTFGGESKIIKDYLSSKQIQLDLILCSHGEMPYIGSLPFLFSSINACPIVSTIPVQSLGLVTLYDAFQSWERTFGDVRGSSDVPSLDLIDSSFSHITTLRHHQTWYLPSPHQSIQITPIPSGHSIGGSIFLIRRGGEEIVYAPSLNHRRSSLIEGASLEHLPRRPSLLIGGCRAALQPPGVSRAEREKNFIDSINLALKNSSSTSTKSNTSPPIILIPVDGASMSLEMGLVLERALQGDHPLIQNCPKALFLSHQSQRLFDLASGMIEWTHPSLSTSFQSTRQNPFQLEKIKSIHSIDEWLKEYSGNLPIIVMATTATLESGFSNWLLQFVLEDPASTILFPSIPSNHTDSSLSSASFLTTTPKTDLSVRLSSSKGAYQRNKIISLSFHEQRPLEGEELIDWRSKRALEDERAKADEAFLLLKKKEEARIDYLIDGEDDGDEDGDGDGDGYDDSDMADPSSKMSKLSFSANDQQSQKISKSNTNIKNNITSASMLRHVRWSDYRTDWKIEEMEAIGDPFNSSYYPLLPFNLAMEDSEGRPNRHQCFPPPPDYIPLPKDGYGERWDPSFSHSTSMDSNLEDVLKMAEHLIDSKTTLKNIVTKQERPMKWVHITKEITLRCSRKIIEWKGGSASLSDGRSLKTIMESMSPQSIVFISGSPEATGYMRNYFELSSSLSSDGQKGSVMCHSPSLLSPITVSSAPNVMQAKLGDSLLSSMNLIRLGSYELGLVRGREKIISGSLGHSSNMMVLEYSGGGGGDSFLGDEALLVGDPRLSELKSTLKEYKLGSHFNTEGHLIVPLKTITNTKNKKRITIRRVNNSFKIDGPLCEEYYVIRDLFYGQVAFLS